MVSLTGLDREKAGAAWSTYGGGAGLWTLGAEGFSRGSSGQAAAP